MNKIINKSVWATGFLVFAFFFIPGIQNTAQSADTNEIKIPFKHALGHQKFQQSCSGCHGTEGQGTKQGPPLMHPFYKPSHHADGAFYRAALKGVKAHHWQFGDMPPVSGITREDMDKIVPFIRWLQREKGLIK